MGNDMKIKATVIYLMSFSGNLLKKLGAKNLWSFCIVPETQSGDLQDAGLERCCYRASSRHIL